MRIKNECGKMMFELDQNVLGKPEVTIMCKRPYQVKGDLFHMLDQVPDEYLKGYVNQRYGCTQFNKAV